MNFNGIVFLPRDCLVCFNYLHISVDALAHYPLKHINIFIYQNLFPFCWLLWSYFNFFDSVLTWHCVVLSLSMLSRFQDLINILNVRKLIFLISCYWYKIWKISYSFYCWVIFMLFHRAVLPTQKESEVWMPRNGLLSKISMQSMRIPKDKVVFQ